MIFYEHDPYYLNSKNWNIIKKGEILPKKIK